MPASREARSTIRSVDKYCQLLEDSFPKVRSFEAKAVGLDNQQNLYPLLIPIYVRIVADVWVRGGSRTASTEPCAVKPI